MNAAALTLQLAVSRDAGPIATMSRYLVEYGLHWIWREEKVRRHIERRDTTVLKALDGRRLAGFGMMVYGDDRAHLNLLAVEREYRQRGVGRRMVEWLEETARVAGIFSVTLEVREGNLGARRFYRALGYREIALCRGYYQAVENAVRMHHDLSVPVSS